MPLECQQMCIRDRDLIQSLKDYNQYIVWDDLSKAIRFEEQLPENFSMDDADCICRCVEPVSYTHLQNKRNM